jgi:ABC-type antimicrobial peptide transport system permease subunit
MKKIPGVLNASSMLGNITSSGDGGGMPGAVVWENKKMILHSAAVNYEMLEILGVEMKEGRSFSKELDSGADTLKWIMNEAAIETLGITDPIGKIVNGYQVIGVVKNFHFQSLHEKVQPFSFRLEPHYAITLFAKIARGHEKETIAKLQQFYKEHNPGFAFDYKFLDQAYQAQYAAEERVAVLSKYFAGLTIIISCLGLFGLAAFTAERRLKEIGIRKVLGSSTFGIVYLLSGDFIKIVFAAIIIALPISYFIAKYWLNNFAYRIELEWWYFAGTGLLALFIAWLTVGTQAIKAAGINPAQCLRDE